jgi:NhaA family Na+:H+ antiporter
LPSPPSPILIEEAKLGILGGSLIAAIAGMILLKGSQAKQN